MTYRQRRALLAWSTQRARSGSPATLSDHLDRVLRAAFLTFAPSAVCVAAGVALWRSATRPTGWAEVDTFDHRRAWLSAALLALAATLLAGRRALHQFIRVARGRTHPLDSLEVRSGLAGMLVAAGGIATSFAATVMALIGP